MRTRRRSTFGPAVAALIAVAAVFSCTPLPAAGGPAVRAAERAEAAAVRTCLEAATLFYAALSDDVSMSEFETKLDAASQKQIKFVAPLIEQFENTPPAVRMSLYESTARVYQLCLREGTV